MSNDREKQRRREYVAQSRPVQSYWPARKDGDWNASRALLEEEIVPCLRELATRRFNSASDIDDSVQD